MKKLLILSLIANIVFIGWSVKHYLFIRKHPQQKVPVAAPNNIYRANYFKMLPNDSNEIVFVGDSETEGFSVTEMFCSIKVKNRGIGGNTSLDVLKRIDEVYESFPQKIFIEVGVNDLREEVPVTKIVNNIYRIVLLIKKNSPTTKIYLQSVLPYRDFEDSIKALNSRISSIKSASYIDLYNSFNDRGRLDPKFDSGDHLHLNGQGYIKWKELIGKYVKE